MQSVSRCIYVDVIVLILLVTLIRLRITLIFRFLFLSDQLSNAAEDLHPSACCLGKTSAFQPKVVYQVGYNTFMKKITNTAGYFGL